jgi:hypothetical protein
MMKFAYMYFFVPHRFITGNTVLSETLSFEIQWS